MIRGNYTKWWAHRESTPAETSFLPFRSHRPPHAFFSLFLRALVTNKCSSEEQRTSLILKFQTHFWCTEIRSALSWSCNRVHGVSISNFQEEILASNVTTKHLESFETNINLHFWRLKVKIRDPHFDDLPSGTGSSVVGASVGSVGSTGSKMWNKWRIEVTERNSNTWMTRYNVMTQWTNSEQMGVKC